MNHYKVILFTRVPMGARTEFMRADHTFIMCAATLEDAEVICDKAYSVYDKVELEEIRL